MGTHALSQGAQQSGCEVNHSHLSISEVKNEWRSPSNPPICLQGVDKNCAFAFTYLHLLQYDLNPLVWQHKVHLAD